MPAFPIPVVALGPGSQQEDETLDYVQMPQDMGTYRPPILPEPEDLAGHQGARAVLLQVLALAQAAAAGGAGGQVSLAGLAAADLRLVGQVLGEGEVSVRVQAEEADDAAIEVQMQESVFTGIWRVLSLRAGQLVGDAIEVGPIPALLRQVAQQDARQAPAPWAGALPPNVQNAPLLVEELRDQVQRWQAGALAHVVNLSLLPVSPEDIAFLDHQLGTGRVLLLSRGYGNCRISNTRLPNCWRVVYYNSMDAVILNTVEVTDMPEVALAAAEDLADTAQRLREVLHYLEAA